jgi:hypothetical protein
MSWRDLESPPGGDWYEMEQPNVLESGGGLGQPVANVVTVTFTDHTSREWFAEWLRSKHSWEAFKAWTTTRT